MEDYDYNGQYKERLTKYLEDHPNSSELEMLRIDVSFHKEHLKELQQEEVTENHPKQWKDAAIKSTKRYLQFIESKLEVAELKNSIENPLGDYSDTNGKNKVIYLYQLGILDFLKSKTATHINVNAVAEILSAITGEKSQTLQPYLNPIFNDHNAQDKNPMRSKANVDKVNQHIIKKGFKPLQ